MSPAIRQFLRTSVKAIARILPARLRYRLGMLLEKLRYSRVTQVHDLPPIFHYWSDRYVRPMFEKHGFSNPDHFFETLCLQLARQHSGQALQLVSIGSGNCDLEVRVARFLRDHQVADFTLECVDINAAMLGRGKALADQHGLGGNLRLTRADFNHWQASGKYHGVIANQSLHHVVNLEHLFTQIKNHLAPGGLLLISDMIGRNGHMRWPEALTETQQFWQQLPDSYHFNHQSQKTEPKFINRDASEHGFEGVRAQDIMPLLCHNFQFHTFLPYGNLIFPFVDRAFGPNFDVNNANDLAFIDAVHARDELLMQRGTIAPTSMIAAVGNERYETRLRDEQLTPEHCLRHPT